DGYPFLYFDMGHAVDATQKPPNWPRRICLRGNPTVVLSHWDEDHYAFPLDDERVSDLPWLVPKQDISPQANKVLRRLSRVRIWPHAHKRFEEYTWGFIVKCDGDDHGNATDPTNPIGLALLVRVQNDSNAPPVGERRALDDEGSRPQIFPDE